MKLWIRVILLVVVLQLACFAQEHPGSVLYKLESGETLGTVSRLFGTSPEKIRSTNGFKRIEAGVTIWIPPMEKGWPVHKLEQERSLEEVAESFQLPVQQLRDANGLTVSTMEAGSEVIIPRARVPKANFTSKPEPVAQTQKPRRALPGSRSGKPKITKPEPLSTEWVEVELMDGRKAWVRTDKLRHETVETVRPKAGVEPLSFGKKLNPSQKQAVFKLVQTLDEQGFSIKADDIVNFMALETGGTFDPAIRAGGRPNGPVGLIQFTDIAIADLNRRRSAKDQLSKSKLSRMSFEQQIEVVGDYLATAFSRKKMRGKSITGADLYSAIFAPRAIGKTLESTVYSRHQDAGPYSRNRSLDQNKDGLITKAELVVRMNTWAERGEKLRD